MSGASGIITGGAQGETDCNAQGLRNGDLGVIEAARAVWGSIGRACVGKSAAVGWAALLLHGATIQTSDVDVGITGESLDAFERAARMDPRFTEYPCGWEHTISFSFKAGVDFMQIGGGCLHQLNGYCLDDDVPVATNANGPRPQQKYCLDRQAKSQRFRRSPVRSRRNGTKRAKF